MGWHDENYPIGLALRQFRRERALSQEAVAAALGVNQSMISKWESGRERPSLANERSIWKLIGEKPIAERLEGLVEAIVSMPMSVALFDGSGRLVAESPVRAAWTGGAGIRDLLTAQDHANFARFGGLETVLSRPGLSFSYHRRRVYTGEHTIISGQNIQLGRVVLHYVSAATLPTVSATVCEGCDGYGEHAVRLPAPCVSCGGFGYRHGSASAGPGGLGHGQGR